MHLARLFSVDHCKRAFQVSQPIELKIERGMIRLALSSRILDNAIFDESILEIVRKPRIPNASEKLKVNATFIGLFDQRATNLSRFRLHGIRKFPPVLIEFSITLREFVKRIRDLEEFKHGCNLPLWS